MNDNYFSSFIKETPPPLSFENQTTISKSKILLINLNTTLTHLAKVLILKGFNLYILDKTLITQNDINANYYLKQSDLNTNKSKTISSFLSHLTAVASITIITDITQAKDAKVACVGFQHFYELRSYEEYFTRKGIYFYCINTSGIYGFSYNNICINNKGKFCVDNILFSRKRDLCLDNFKRKENVFKNNKACLEIAIYLIDLFYIKNVDKKNIKKEIEQSDDYNMFQKKMFFIENFLNTNNIKINKKNKEMLMDVIKKLLTNFNKEFAPICIMMSKYISEQIFSILLSLSRPQCGLYTYDSESDNYDYISFLDN